MGPNPKDAPVLGTLEDAKDQGLAGRVVCAACKSPDGSLEGRTFYCNTEGCKYRRKPLPRNPWGRE